MFYQFESNVTEKIEETLLKKMERKNNLIHSMYI